MKFQLTVVHVGLLGCFEVEERAEEEGKFLISGYLFEKKQNKRRVGRGMLIVLNLPLLL